MNKKYDHLQLMAELDSDQFRVYNACAINSMYFTTMIYNAICQSNAINSQVFKKEWFIEWANADLADDNVTRLESEVIKWIHDYPGFFDFYKGDWSVDSIINSVIQSWKNKPNSLRLSKLGMLYANFMRFIGTSSGQNFLYGTTAFDLMENYAADEELPFYERAEYRFEQLNKCKKEVILEISKNGTEVIESMALWDAIFKCEGKFTIAKALNIAKNDPKMSLLSDMQIRRHLKVLMVKLLKALLKGDRLDVYFDTDYMISVDGAYYTLRKALEYYLITAQEDVDGETPKKSTAYSKIINGKVNVHAYTKDELKIIIDNFCKSNGIPYSLSSGYYKGVAKLKIDAELKQHKQYKLWFYEGGGYRDFYNDRTGYITEIIPKEYFEKV